VHGTSVWTSDSSEVLGHDHGKNDSLLEKLLGVITSSYVVPLDVGVLLNYVAFERLDQVLVDTRRFEFSLGLPVGIIRLQASHTTASAISVAVDSSSR
jgi:hypothetical protein